ncbi:translation initiation factor IF-2 [Alosa sapidissima]|uniref:translation initiation factor IF-2 n=1 Tax=Alosa sapidissima TaxID=34773 RepID=UPI001C08663E|nr:translation initiation factor IF-2 [Alosa sapidissima]
MTEKHPVSKLKRRKTSLEECKSEQPHRTVPRESMGSFLALQEQRPSCNRAAYCPSGVVQDVQDWWAQPGLPPLERLWALTLQAFSAQPPEPSATEQLPELPSPHTQTCARVKPAEWRWCCLGDEVGALPERPAVAQRAPASAASSGQRVPVTPANAVPTETTCLSRRSAPEPEGACAGASGQARGTAGQEGEEDEEEVDGGRRSGPVTVPTEASQRWSQGGGRGRRGIAAATSRPAASSASSLAAATDARAKGWRESAAGTAATATAGVTLDAFFGGGGGRGGGGEGRGKEEGIKRRPTDQRSGTQAPPTPSPGQQGASAGAGGAGVRGLECCPMCLMPFPAGFTQMDCDGHLAQCLSEMNTDMVW